MSMRYREISLSVIATVRSHPCVPCLTPPSLSLFLVLSSVQLIRNETGDIVERVELLDQFTNKKNGKESHAYRCVSVEYSVSPISPLIDFSSAFEIIPSPC